MECTRLKDSLWSGRPEASSDPHLASCESCRDELRRADQLLSTLALMRDDEYAVPAGLKDTIRAALAPDRTTHRLRVSDPVFVRRAAAASGAAVAAIAAVGLIVARRRASPAQA